MRQFRKKPPSVTTEREQYAAHFHAVAVKLWRASIAALRVGFDSTTASKAARMRLAHAIDDFTAAMSREWPK